MGKKRNLGDYLLEAARTLLSEPRFLDVLPGLDNERIRERLASIAAGIFALLVLLDARSAG